MVNRGGVYESRSVVFEVPKAVAVRARVREEIEGPRRVVEDGALGAIEATIEDCARAESEGVPSPAAAEGVAEEIANTLGA